MSFMVHKYETQLFGVATWSNVVPSWYSIFPTFRFLLHRRAVRFRAGDVGLLVWMALDWNVGHNMGQENKHGIVFGPPSDRMLHLDYQ